MKKEKAEKALGIEVVEVEEEQDFTIGTKVFHKFYGHGFIIGEMKGNPDTVRVDFHNGNVFGIHKTRIKDNTVIS